MVYTKKASDRKDCKIKIDLFKRDKPISYSEVIYAKPGTGLSFIDQDLHNRPVEFTKHKNNENSMS